MKTLAVIPARLGAVRLPRKPLRLLAGAPLIVRVWQRVAAMGLTDTLLVVATDDETVASAVRAEGAECVMTSDQHTTGSERVAEVASMPQFADFETIVNIQGDEPFIGPAAIDGAIKMVTSGRFELGTSASPANSDIGDNPNVVKVVVADDGRALYFSRAHIPFVRDPESAEGLPVMLQHIGVYAYSRNALAKWVALPPHPLEKAERLEQLRPLAAGIPMGVAIARETPASGIDTEDDLARANARWLEFIGER
ncbi:MAG: 3-deoxy-manno-octulosonate cytidylyltransferase [Gemmatimonadaceae bacterium]